MTSRLLVLVPAAALLVAALADPAGATTTRASLRGGAPDSGAHPYVVALVPPGGTGPACTGVYVRSDFGARAVLTDAHCVFDGHRTGGGWTAVFGNAVGAPRSAGTWVVSASYRPTSSYLHDWAVLVLARPPDVRTAVLAAPGRQERDPERTVTTVGTGSPHPGQWRSATEVVTRWDASWLYLRPGTGNSCSGDSGGPDLVRGTDTVLALTDQGTCDDDQDLRVDTHEVHRAVVDVTRTLRPVVVRHPSSATATAGSSVTFTAAASGAPAGVTWQRSRDSGSSWGAVPGATGTALVVRASDGTEYRAVFRNSAGTATSGPAVLTVRSLPPAPVGPPGLAVHARGWARHGG